MPVETNIANLSQTAASNSPPGSESPTTIDDYHRQALAFIATIRDGKGFTDPVQLASAATTSIGAQNSMFVEITGTTTITSFGTTYEGPRFLRFTGALTLTHNSTTLNLPGAANITTAAGDTAIAVPNQALNGWNVVQFQFAAGGVVGTVAIANGGTGATTAAAAFSALKQAATESATGVVELATTAEVQTGTDTSRAITPAALRAGGLVIGATVASTSGTSVDFTSIPSWAKRITMNLSGVSTNGTDNWLIQLGDSGGVESSGYSGAAANIANAASPTVTNYAGAGFVIPSGGGGNVITGSVVLTLLDSATNLWVGNGNLPLTSSANLFITGGSKALSATLDRVRLTTTGGTNTFDAGSVNILYE